MINRAVIKRNVREAVKDSIMDCDWMYDDCRLENNGLIRKGCGFNQSFKYNVPLVKLDISMNIINWCDKYCDCKFGWFFEDCRPSRSWPARHLSCEWIYILWIQTGISSCRMSTAVLPEVLVKSGRVCRLPGPPPELVRARKTICQR